MPTSSDHAGPTAQVTAPARAGHWGVEGAVFRVILNHRSNVVSSCVLGVGRGKRSRPLDPRLRPRRILDPKRRFRRHPRRRAECQLADRLPLTPRRQAGPSARTGFPWPPSSALAPVRPGTGRRGQAQREARCRPALLTRLRCRPAGAAAECLSLRGTSTLEPLSGPPRPVPGACSRPTAPRVHRMGGLIRRSSAQPGPRSRRGVTRN